MNYHQILGIKPDASPEEIKKAYRRLARKHHPDVRPNDPNAAAKFIEIREAYECALAEKVGGLRPEAKSSPYQAPKDPIERKRNEEREEVYRFITNLEQLCLRTVHKEYHREMRTLVNDYFRRVWTLDLVRKINDHASIQQKWKIIDLSKYLFKMVSNRRANNVYAYLQRVAGENPDLKFTLTGIKQMKTWDGFENTNAEMDEAMGMGAVGAVAGFVLLGYLSQPDAKPMIAVFCYGLLLTFLIFRYRMHNKKRK